MGSPDIPAGFETKARAGLVVFTAGNYQEQSTAEKRAIEVLRDGLVIAPNGKAVFQIVRVDEAWVEPL